MFFVLFISAAVFLTIRYDADSIPLQPKIFETELHLRRYHILEGSSEKSCQITVDERTMAVNKNIFEALKYLRSAMADRILRIRVDITCINQNNDAERMHQTRYMGNTYKLADKVLIWLGPQIT